MANHMKFCGCKSCKAGMHRGMGWVVKAAIRKLRRQTKQELKQGKEPTNKVSVPYTD